MTDPKTPEIPEGMKPWHGGDSAPDDWDGGDTRLRCGGLCPKGYAFRWVHTGDRDDIIAYTPTPQVAPAPLAMEKIMPTLEKGGRFLKWSTVDLAAQCLSQAREQLDPDFSEFMAAVAARLSTQVALAPSQATVEVTQDEDVTATQDDREAAADYVAKAFGDRYRLSVLHEGRWPALVQAFARHRLAALQVQP